MAALLDELIAALATWSPGLAGGLSHDTPLLSSGRLDSAALFQLLLWIEGKIGRPVDVTGIDMPAQWNTADMIVAFIERERTSRR